MSLSEQIHTWCAKKMSCSSSNRNRKREMNHWSTLHLKVDSVLKKDDVSHFHFHNQSSSSAVSCWLNTKQSLLQLQSAFCQVLVHSQWNLSHSFQFSSLAFSTLWRADVTSALHAVQIKYEWHFKLSIYQTHTWKSWWS